MTKPPEPQLRLLIGASSYVDARPALQLAERLAETLAGDLGGLLIEDIIVAEVIDMPRQRVVTSSGTLVMAPTRQQVRNLTESDARAFRESLSGLAQNKARKWSFERGHGDLVSGLCAAATGWDILLLGHREIHRQAGKVVLIAPPAAAPQRATELATHLSRALQTDLIALSVDPADTGTGAQHDGGFATDSAMLAYIDRTNAAAVVLDLSAGPLHSHDQLRQLLAVARCPVLVLGADAAPAAEPAQ